MNTTLRSALFALLSLAGGLAMRADEPVLIPGGRVLVDKAGLGHRAIILKTEPGRCFVAYEGEDEKFDEWVDASLIRVIKPHPAMVAQVPATQGSAPGQTDAASKAAVTTESDVKEDARWVTESLVLPRPAAGESIVPAWLEVLPRSDGHEKLSFNEAQLVRPRLEVPAAGGIVSSRAPRQVVVLPARESLPVGFAAIEGNGVVIYRAGADGQFSPADRLAVDGFGAHDLADLKAGDLNGDGSYDLVVVGGPFLQVYFATADGRFVATEQAYRSKLPLRLAAVGRFFSGANPRGIAVVEGENSFRLLSATAGGVTAVAEPATVKFDRILDLVAGDFDGDGFTDLAVATETKGRSTGAWMYFNQNSTSHAFIWPVGGKDDFARKLLVDDLDRDGRDDLIMSDNDADRGERVRVVFGSAGRSGWEDPWEVIGRELGIGLGTGVLVAGDFNHDGRRDIGVAGRNGLRLYLGADYRRFSRNPVWPAGPGGRALPDQRAFVAADFNGDQRIDLLGFTPVFATGYNVLLNVTPSETAGIFVPPPLKKKSAAESGNTVNKVERVRDTPPGTPELKFLASRAEPYGPYRYRIVVEVAASDDDGVVQAVTGTCKYANEGPLQEVTAVGQRLNDEQWSLEVILPRGRNYEFTIVARDDKDMRSSPMRVAVSP